MNRSKLPAKPLPWRKILRCAFAGLALPWCAGLSSAATLYFTNAYDYVDGSSAVQSYNPNAVTLATQSISGNGETSASSASLSGGTLKVLNTGNVTALTSVNTGSFASLGDTITSTGATAGLNLGVSLAVSGTAYSVTPSGDDTFLVIAAYAPGVFDSNNYGSSIWAAGYQLGTNSGGSAPFFLYGISSVTGVYGDGANNIPVSIPFALLPSTFDLFVGLASYENGSGLVWSNDYSHTVTLSLLAPNGVNLASASGALPITSQSSTPEPYTLGTAGFAILAGLAILRGRKQVTTATR